MVAYLTAALTALWLRWPETPPSSKVTICKRRSQLWVWLGVRTGSHAGFRKVGAAKRTNRIDLPLPHVLVHNALDEVGIPPDSGVVLQLGVVQGDASLGMDP
jgi:hypothetical protein